MDTARIVPLSGRDALALLAEHQVGVPEPTMGGFLI